MDNATITAIIGQLGASGVFALAVVIIAKTFYSHYEAEIQYLRNKVDCLEERLMGVEQKTAKIGQ